MIQQRIDTASSTDADASCLPGAERPLPVFLSRSPVIEQMMATISMIANSPASVLITGESGSGKEVIAQYIHACSNRSAQPFIAINAAALPKDVIDNELFGHEKEAFTGAISKKSGCFEMADRGTLFLDEIAEMHPQTQAKLLRAIESKSFRRLGGKEEVTVDVRVVAATNKNIQQAIQSGEFREDLFYRLSVIELALPPLRSRREDVPLLTDYFLAFFARKYELAPKTVSPEAMEMMSAFNWPGNVRELRNLTEGLTLMCPDCSITPKALPERISNHAPQPLTVSIPVGTPLDMAERIFINHTLASVEQNKSAAAKILGISRKTLHNKLNVLPTS
ncbi:MAG TPA: sigma-54 dependent transcriptional regulator [Bacteroidota bacterium]|nr:sigma-54 dependent transcriptional regulator [Bacteroidota bacterium]